MYALLHTVKYAQILKALCLHTNSFQSLIRLHDTNQSLFHMNKKYFNYGRKISALWNLHNSDKRNWAWHK